MQLILISAVLFGLAVMIIFIGAGRAVASRSANRLEDYMSDQFGQAGSMSSERASGRKGSAEFVQGFDKIIRSISIFDNLAKALTRAGLKFTVTEYMLVWLACIAGAAFLGNVITHHWMPTLLIGLVGAVGPYMFIGFRQGQRIRTFNGQLANCLAQLSGSLRAGYGLLQALDFVAHEAAPPAGIEFAQVVRDVKLGRTVIAALEDLQERIASDDLQLVVTAIRIHHETGGNLAEILDTVSATIHERVRIKGELNSLTAQQRYSGYVLAVLPILMFFILMLINPSYESRLLTPGPTLCIPIGAIIMMAAGFIIIQRIVTIEV